MKKNIIILDSLVKYNVVKIYNRDVVRIPDYLINDCIANKKQLVVTHKHKTILQLDHDKIIDHINTIDTKEFEGTINGKEIKYKLVLIGLDNGSKV